MTRKPLYLLAFAALLLAAAFWLVLILERAEGRRIPLMGLTSLRGSGDALYVPDQRPGWRVRIGFAGLAEGGFIAIHDGLAGFGRPIGMTQYVPSGQTRNFDVILSEPTAPGAYYAALYRDNDGDQAYEPKKDHPARNVWWGRFKVKFQVSDDAPFPPTIRP